MRTPCRTCGRLIRVETPADAPAEAPVRDAPPLPPWFPFCSERCKMADLGRWFAEDYRVGGRTSGPVDDASGEG